MLRAVDEKNETMALNVEHLLRMVNPPNRHCPGCATRQSIRTLTHPGAETGQTSVWIAAGLRPSQ
jgi:hypothetical protein